MADNDKKSVFGAIVSAFFGIALFVTGVLLAVWATERLLEGLVGLSVALRLSAFAVGAVLSGFEVENVAVGLAAGARGTAPVALGTVFGGAIFLVCVALGVGAVLFPLEIRLPRGVLMVFAASPLLVGISLVAPITPRWTGVVLLIAFVAAMFYLVNVSRHQNFLVSGEVSEEQEKQRPLWVALGFTLVGIVIIGLGGELVALGAEGMIAALGMPALFMGMIVSPAAIELEEVIRQVIPSKEGRHDVSAGNLVGTLLYFLLFNLGLIALLTPVRVDPLVRKLDWPFLIVVTLIAAAFLWRGRVGRGAGVLLLVAYAVYVVLHVVFR
jgi:cation:H+ antiporter